MSRVTVPVLLAGCLVTAFVRAAEVTEVTDASPVDVQAPGGTAPDVGAIDAGAIGGAREGATQRGSSPESLLLLPTTWGELPPAWAEAESRFDGQTIIGVGRGSSLRSAAAVALAGAARAREAKLRAESLDPGDDATTAAEGDGDAPSKRPAPEPGEEVEREPGAVARVTQATWDLGRVAIHARVMRSRQKDPPTKETVETTGLKLEDGSRSFVLFVTRTDRLRGGESRETVNVESTSAGLSFEDLLSSLRDAGVKMRVHQTSTEFFVEAVWSQR